MGGRCVVKVGDPAQEILVFDAAEKPNLIVVATHGRRGWHHWVIGSVAERVVQLARADVLAIRSPHEEDVREPPAEAISDHDRSARRSTLRWR